MYFEQNNPYGFENKSKDNQIPEDPASNFNTKRSVIRTIDWYIDF